MSRVGSPFYLSPEICQNLPYGTESDVWSLGCVLYEMVCLSKAFFADNMVAVVQRICSASYAPPPPGACSDGVRDLISQMLQLQPEKRPTVQQVLQHAALRPMLSQLEPPTPPAALRCRLEVDSDEVQQMQRAVREAAASRADDAARRQGKQLNLTRWPPPRLAPPSNGPPQFRRRGAGVVGGLGTPRPRGGRGPQAFTQAAAHRSTGAAPLERAASRPAAPSDGGGRGEWELACTREIRTVLGATVERGEAPLARCWCWPWGAMRRSHRWCRRPRRPDADCEGQGATLAELPPPVLKSSGSSTSWHAESTLAA